MIINNCNYFQRFADIDVAHAMDVGAAFNNPSSGKIDQQRKILEVISREDFFVKIKYQLILILINHFNCLQDLERQKKLLKVSTMVSYWLS